MNKPAFKKEITSKKSLNKTKKQLKRSKPATKPSKGQSLAYAVYLNSLAPTGRKAMCSLLNKVPQLLGSRCAPERFPWSELDYQKLQQIRSQMQLEAYSPNTVNQMLCALRGVSKAAFNLEQIDAEKLMRIQAVKTTKGSAQREGRSLTIQQVRKVLKYLTNQRTLRSKRDKAIFLLGIGAGLRCAELVNIEAGDVCLETGRVVVVKGKGNKNREVFVGDNVLKALKEWIDVVGASDGPMFRHIYKGGEVGQKLTTNGVRSIVSELAKSAGVEAFTPHDFRRTFITHLLAAKVDLHSVSLLAGHKNISTTILYNRLNEDSLRNASRGLKF